MWIDAEKKPERERVYECYREFPDGSHCTEHLRWTGSEWITNDAEGYPRRDVLKKTAGSRIYKKRFSTITFPHHDKLTATERKISGFPTLYIGAVTGVELV